MTLTIPPMITIIHFVSNESMKNYLRHHTAQPVSSWSVLNHINFPINTRLLLMTSLDFRIVYFTPFIDAIKEKV